MLALKPAADLIQNLGSLVDGEVVAPAAIEQEPAMRFRLLGTQGLAGMTLSGIEIALWGHAGTGEQHFILWARCPRRRSHETKGLPVA
jgi:hypothetical protein